VIQIDVHLVRENPTNTSHTFHARSTYDPWPYVYHVVHVQQLFVRSSIELDGCTASEKKCSWLHPSARLSDPQDPPQFLSQHSHWSSALKPSTCWRHATKLTGPISPTCDRYVQYLLTVTNPSTLNRHRRELQPWRRWLSRYHFLTFPTDSLPFSPTSPVRSPV
jgi:hypothetical protein